MNVLLVEPDYRRHSPAQVKRLSKDAGNRCDDESLWYPPLGLMKLSRFHKDKGDHVQFVYGPEKECLKTLWDRVYITTLFTFGWNRTETTIKFYKKAVGGVSGNIYVGGIMSSIMAQDIFEETGIFPIIGILDSARKIGFSENTNIDLLTPDYGLLDNSLYAINDTYYGYTSRGCVNRCAWCAVPKIEPIFIPYINIKPMIIKLRSQYGDKARLKLMDNNILASPSLPKIVDDLCELGYGKDKYTDTDPKKRRVIDFNQGLDASFVNEATMSLLSKLNIRPFRIAFDRAAEEKVYLLAISTAMKYGFFEFSNYLLYNWHDSPRDLYNRLMVNIKLNSQWSDQKRRGVKAAVYSYPMRYAPINGECGQPHANRYRDFIASNLDLTTNHLENPKWTQRFIRNIEIMKGAAHGAISPTPGLALRTVGKTFEEYITNLFMPEILLRNRNKYEKKVYADEPDRHAGSGAVEDFRKFILKCLRKPTKESDEFLTAISLNSSTAIKDFLKRNKNKELRKWAKNYLLK